jgi:hypothetical protein
MNLLPAPYQPKPITVTKLVGVPAGLALAGLIAPLIITLQNTNANIATAQNQLSVTNKAINEKTKQKTELTASVKTLEKNLADARAAYNRIDVSKKYMVEVQNNFNSDIDLSLDKLPSDIKLTSIAQSDEALVVQGTAPTERDIRNYAQSILQYARDMDYTKQYTQCVISAITVQGAEGNNSAASEEILYTLTFQRGE